METTMLMQLTIAAILTCFVGRYIEKRWGLVWALVFAGLIGGLAGSIHLRVP